MVNGKCTKNGRIAQAEHCVDPEDTCSNPVATANHYIMDLDFYGMDEFG